MLLANDRPAIGLVTAVPAPGAPPATSLAPNNYTSQGIGVRLDDPFAGSGTSTGGSGDVPLNDLPTAPPVTFTPGTGSNAPPAPPASPSSGGAGGGGGGALRPIAPRDRATFTLIPSDGVTATDVPYDPLAVGASSPISLAAIVALAAVAALVWWFTQRKGFL